MKQIVVDMDMCLCKLHFNCRTFNILADDKK